MSHTDYLMASGNSKDRSSGGLTAINNLQFTPFKKYLSCRN